MRRLRLFGLGARLATAGGPRAWARLGLMALGFMLGSAMLLSAASIVPALHARDVRRNGVLAIDHRGGPGALRIWPFTQSFGELDVRTPVVSPIGAAPVPPGLSRVPEPGEIFASERLVEMWSTVGPAIEQRLHGHLAGTIGREGLIGPDDLQMWVGKPADVRLPLRAAYVQRSFGVAHGTPEPLDLGALLLIMVVTSAIVLPIWLFVATATRLSAATREARLAAVRLAGATEGQVRSLAATEAGVAACLGSCLGVPVFLLFRPVLASGAIAGIQMFTSDLRPPTGLAIALLIALPGLAVAMSLATMRRLIVSPLGVVRHARRSHAGWRWMIVLGVGLAVLAWSASRHSDLQRFGNVMTFVLVGGSLACIGFGLAGSATWSAWAVAHRLAGSVRHASAMLGLRRLEAEPGSVSRVVGGIALMIALVGAVQAGLIGAERTEGGPFLPVEAYVLREGDIGVLDGPKGTSSVGVGDIPGVTSVRWTHRIRYGRSGSAIGIIRYDGSPATLEAVRDRFAWTGADVTTLPQLREEAKLANDDYSSFRRGALAITLFLFLVSGATLLVAMVDWLMERRRSLAVLSAIGTSASTVRRSIFVQVGLPLATSIAFGLAGAIGVTILLYTAVEQPIAIPTRQLAVLVLAVVTVVFFVNALAAPWLRIARDPELLREA